MEIIGNRKTRDLVRLCLLHCTVFVKTVGRRVLWFHESLFNRGVVIEQTQVSLITLIRDPLMNRCMSSGLDVMSDTSVCPSMTLLLPNVYLTSKSESTISDLL